MWDLVVLVRNYCFSCYFVFERQCNSNVTLQIYNLSGKYGFEKAVIEGLILGYQKTFNLPIVLRLL